MKNLKIKFGLFSLLAVLAVSVFLTSCEQEVVADQSIPDNTPELLSVEGTGDAFILPYGYDELNQEEKDEYINSLDDKTIAELIESSKIADYFTHLGKHDILQSNAKHGDVFNQSTLSSYLTSDEIEAFTTTDFQASVESRWGCGEWFYLNNRAPCWCGCAYWYYGSCYSIRCAVQQKRICDYRPDQYRWIFVPSYNCN